MKLIKYLALILFFVNCKQEKTEKEKVKNIESVSNEALNNEHDYSNNSLDALLKCGEYSLMDGYFTVPDYGCIYQPNSLNKLGNAEIYIVPKMRLAEDADIEKEENKINKMIVDDLKKNNELYILLINKKYLKYDTKMDVPYYPIIPYQQTIYKYENNQWKKLMVLEIKKENDPQYEDWKTKNLIIARSNSERKTIDLKGHYYIKTPVSSVENGDPIDVSFYFSFDTKFATLSIGTDNSLEAYCEGSYSIDKKGDVLKLEYIGEGTCTSDKDESTFLIKNENNQFYIKSKRFYDFEWKVLESKK